MEGFVKRQVSERPLSGRLSAQADVHRLVEFRRGRSRTSGCEREFEGFHKLIAAPLRARSVVQNATAHSAQPESEPIVSRHRPMSNKKQVYLRLLI
jgi:hypothetical protein